MSNTCFRGAGSTVFFLFVVDRTPGPISPQSSCATPRARNFKDQHECSVFLLTFHHKTHSALRSTLDRAPRRLAGHVAMDPFKILGVANREIKGPSDVEKLRRRAKKLFKRYASEKKKFEAKKVLEAFEHVQRSQKMSDIKILGRSRKERELDKHFNHQTKEIKNNKEVRRHLKRARKGTRYQRMHLPGDKDLVKLFVVTVQIATLHLSHYTPNLWHDETQQYCVG